MPDETSNNSGPKIFDVARPGSFRENATSKPVVTGQLQADPMLRTEDSKDGFASEEVPNEAQNADQTVPEVVSNESENSTASGNDAFEPAEDSVSEETTPSESMDLTDTEDQIETKIDDNEASVSTEEAAAPNVSVDDQSTQTAPELPVESETGPTVVDGDSTPALETTADAPEHFFRPEMNGTPELTSQQSPAEPVTTVVQEPQSSAAELAAQPVQDDTTSNAFAPIAADNTNNAHETVAPASASKSGSTRKVVIWLLVALVAAAVALDVILLLQYLKLR